MVYGLRRCYVAGAAPVPRLAATPVPFEGRLIEVTVSIGVTSYRHPESVEAMLARADELMYSAKHAGHSRVVSDLVCKSGNPD